MRCLARFSRLSAYRSVTCLGPSGLQFGRTPFSLFRQNLVKPPRRRFLDYVVD